MSEEMNVSKPEGKGLAVGGFVISLVGLLFSTIVMAMVTLSVLGGGGKGLGYFWVILCLASVVMSAMGMKKLGATGGKKGLAIAGLVIGIVAFVWSLMMLMSIGAVESAAYEGFTEAMENIQEMEELSH